MNGEIFFWYVFPLIVAAAAFGWVLYDRSTTKRDHLHPGE